MPVLVDSHALGRLDHILNVLIQVPKDQRLHLMNAASPLFKIIKTRSMRGEIIKILATLPASDKEAFTFEGASYIANRLILNYK